MSVNKTVRDTTFDMRGDEREDRRGDAEEKPNGETATADDTELGNSQEKDSRRECLSLGSQHVKQNSMYHQYNSIIEEGFTKDEVVERSLHSQVLEYCQDLGEEKRRWQA